MMRKASTILATTLSLIQVLVAASTSSPLRGIQRKGRYSFQKGHDRITKHIDASRSISDSYGYGGDFYGSIPKESKAKKEESKNSNGYGGDFYGSIPKESKVKKEEKGSKRPKPINKGQQQYANRKGVSKKGKDESKKDLKGSDTSQKVTSNPYNGATGIPSISPVVATTTFPSSVPQQTLAPLAPTEATATQSPTFTASATTPQTVSPTTSTSTASTTLPATQTPTSRITIAPTQAPTTVTSTPTTSPSITPTGAFIPTTPATSIAPSAPSASAAVSQRILPYALHGGQEFSSSTSYQSQSLSFVASIPGVDKLANAKVVQYYALGCIYFATFAVANPATEASLGKGVIPPGWVLSTNWLNLTIDPCSGANATIAVWKGVGCEDGRVTRVSLQANALTGTFPPEITILSADNPSKSGNLNYLDLSSNGNLFANNLDDWIGMLGSNLQFLYFSATSFFSTNGVPDAISNLTSLKELDCSYSLLTGPLRDAPFKGLNNIDFVVLSGNAYNSTIPTVFRSLPSLQYLYLQNAFLSGDLSFAQGLQNIQELWVDQNPGIAGPIFSFFGDLPMLQSLSLTDNSLTGTLPPEISKLTNMLSMWYYNNKLGGTFPQEWSSLARLEKLEIEANAISGKLTSFCQRLAPPSGVLTDLGADCKNLTACPCCTCCSLKQCNAIFRL